MISDHHGRTAGSIGFCFPAGQFAPSLIALVTPDGAAREVADGLAFPNGLAISPDGATLIVAESCGSRLTACDIGRGGALGGRRTWADTSGGHPDGICADSEGAVWYADVGSRRCVRVREGGEVLDIVSLDWGAFAWALSRGRPAPVRRRRALRRILARAAQRPGRRLPGPAPGPDGPGSQL
ncbi:MAG TPA: SMP-30/gluconolactonase/LRE family protein [Streptosporangiaceae bacterium]|nr:SMP-30/gluconolactonase/LRE family protein [Streptosporangiaceae bacterium]